MTLSVIIPIYDVADCLPRLLDSIYAQGLAPDEHEVICVNDGSTDNSLSVAQSYAALHPNLIIIDQPNAGVSIARNNAMARAQGDYILFADPDDRFCPGSIAPLLKETKAFPEADIIVCNSLDNDHRPYDWRNLFQENRLYGSTQILNGGLLRGSVCGVCFKRAFLIQNGITFLPKVRNGEDTAFFLQAMYHTNRTLFLNQDLYEIIGRQGSASRLYTPRRIDAMINSVEKISQLRDRLSRLPGNRPVLDYMIYSILLNLVKDTFRTRGTGYFHLRRAGIGRYCHFPLSPDTRFLRNKMELINRSFFAFYFIRRIKLFLQGRR